MQKRNTVLKNPTPYRQIFDQIANLLAGILRDLVPAVMLENSGIRAKLQ